MTQAQALALASCALLLVAMTTRNESVIEAGDGEGLALSLDGASDEAEAFYNRMTEDLAMVDQSTAERNLAAFGTMVALAEGTQGRGGYACVYGYGHTIKDFTDHPANTGEWRGEVLSDAMCAGAGFGPGCKSTAAGKYQITRPTWREFGGVAKFGDFGPSGQEACFQAILAKHGALEEVKAGRVMQAVYKIRTRWASLPGNTAGQGKRSESQLLAWYAQQGGVFA
jgi:muramidase (phage lysozyme)